MIPADTPQTDTAVMPEAETGERALSPGETSAPFQVRLEVFEGPLDLLLRLIERKQLDISKVALAEVTDAFLAYVEAHPEMPPGPMAAFVWVASKLLWIKSQMLLPRPPITHEGEEEDPGDELVRRLEAYKQIQDTAKWLRQREAEGLRSYERPVSLTEEEINALRIQSAAEGTGLEGVTLARLIRMVQKRMQLALPTVPPQGTAVSGHTITVGEKVSELRKKLHKLNKGERMPLGDHFAEAAARSRTELVVLFLAVLEIIRRKYGRAEQDELFGEIWLTHG